LADSAHYDSGYPKSVSLEQTERAIACVPYLRSHAERIYAPVVQSQIERAIRLAEKLKGRELSSPFTARDVYNRSWELLNTSEWAQEAIGYLVQAGWLREGHVATTDRGGRPTIQYYSVLVESKN